MSSAPPLQRQTPPTHKDAIYRHSDGKKEKDGGQKDIVQKDKYGDKHCSSERRHLEGERGE